MSDRYRLAMARAEVRSLELKLIRARAKAARLEQAVRRKPATAATRPEDPNPG